MATDFKIKYLFEIFPDTDFTEEWVLCQDVNELPPEPDIVETPEIWGDVKSSIKRNRKIQTKVLRKYEVKLILARDIDWAIVDYAEYTTCTTDTSGTEETFLIYNVDIQQTKVPQSLEYIVTITFLREEDKIVYHTASDNVLSYKTDESATVNEIQFDVKNPSYSFNNVNVTSTVSTASFKIPFNSLLDTISIGDTYYLHTDNPTFDALQDAAGEYLCFAQCGNKTSTELTFVCSSTVINAPTGIDYTINNMIIDHVSDGRDLPPGVVVANKTESLVIYTFLEPEFSHETDLNEGAETNYGAEENQTTKERDIAQFKVWLKLNEKWKAEYLNYALKEDITISLKNYDDILPAQVKDIISPVENRRLINLFEYDIKVIYNIKSVNLNR